jgi:hypothetical protein
LFEINREFEDQTMAQFIKKNNGPLFGPQILSDVPFTIQNPLILVCFLKKNFDSGGKRGENIITEGGGK